MTQRYRHRNIMPLATCLLLAVIAYAASACGSPPSDPGPDAGHCGDNVCDDGETVATCPTDCHPTGGPTCGNHICESGEMTSCPQDCPVTCGNHICDPGETIASCPQDCTCGNHVCDPGETLTSCPQDCTCGNHVCDPGETAASCPQDCPVVPRCGNNICELGETPASCPQDCHICGDNICEPGETPLNCPQDCHTCGDNVCDPGETTTSCPHDCTATLITHNTSSYTVEHLYVFACTATSEGPDQLGVQTIPSGQSFTLTNIPPGCYRFHATTVTGLNWGPTGNINLTGAETYTWTLTN